LAQSLIIPPRPEILLNIQKVMREEDPDVNAISKLMKEDISLYAIFLSAANSPWMGLSQPATSIEHAVMLMGLDRIYAMIQAIMVRNSFADAPLKEHFWTTAIDVAGICSDLSNRFSGFDRNQAYSIGMLHNAGIAIMIQQNEGFKEFITDHHQTPSNLLCIHERHRFGTDHFLQGALMARQWNLGEDVALCIRYQPLADKILNGQKEVSDSVATYLAILTIAKSISAEFRRYWSTDLNEDRTNQDTADALNYLHINHSEYYEIKEDMLDNYMNKTSA